MHVEERGDGNNITALRTTRTDPSVGEWPYKCLGVTALSPQSYLNFPTKLGNRVRAELNTVAQGLIAVREHDDEEGK